MTVLDRVFLVMAGLDVVFVGVMVWVALQMLDRAKRAQRDVAPALREARALAETGKTLVSHARQGGRAMSGRAKSVALRVKQRYETTKQIAAELKGPGRETTAVAASAARETGRRARAAGSLARSLKRVKDAADAAAAAARTP